MLGYLLGVVVLVAAVWWLWRVLADMLRPARPVRLNYGGARTRCPKCGDLLTGLEIAALREGRRRCPYPGRCPFGGPKLLRRR